MYERLSNNVRRFAFLIYLYEVKEDLEIFFFEYQVALCLSIRKYSILNLRIVTLRYTILQTFFG